MAISDGFVDHCAELLAAAGRIESRRMFGGVGLYAEGIFLAIVVGDTLYLRTDDESRGAFVRAKCRPFEFTSRGKLQSTGYWSVPPDAMDSPSSMAPWARLAMQAALRAAAAKKPRRRGPAAQRMRT